MRFCKIESKLNLPSAKSLTGKNYLKVAHAGYDLLFKAVTDLLKLIGLRSIKSWLPV
jgi:hypothetical protein